MKEKVLIFKVIYYSNTSRCFTQSSLYNNASMTSGSCLFFNVPFSKNYKHISRLNELLRPIKLDIV
jgi:hypothetical protein